MLSAKDTAKLKKMIFRPGTYVVGIFLVFAFFGTGILLSISELLHPERLIFNILYLQFVFLAIKTALNRSEQNND